MSINLRTLPREIYRVLQGNGVRIMKIACDLQTAVIQALTHCRTAVSRLIPELTANTSPRKSHTRRSAAK